MKSGILLFGLLFCSAWLVAAGAPPQAPSPGLPAQPAAPARKAEQPPKKKKHSHADDFLMRGTVFSDKALALPGAELRIRKTTEKKFRWETRTNSRGEFAARVPQGAGYELTVRARGFAGQAKTVDARSGAREERMVFRLERAAKGLKEKTKTGEKK